MGVESARWRNTHFPEKECSRLDGVQNHDFLIQGIPINSEFHSLFNHFVNGDGHGVCNHTPTRDEHGGGYISISPLSFDVMPFRDACAWALPVGWVLLVGWGSK